MNRGDVILIFFPVLPEVMQRPIRQHHNQVLAPRFKSLEP
jgi:hypothetical protein